ncbi:ATP-binding cassette domain-containing protein [Nocardioides convexus]|uniref:ATP-binding cassette domain-containing protein n=1 Tax=Nocardioides convexus TaxID=2712224 RepID=UPI00241856F3|nr:ATP-binding cassette domain-containing protein [Nocardioides convexus]
MRRRGRGWTWTSAASTSPTPRAGFALRDVDLHVPAGQTIALVGRSGSGKSTLASLLSRAVEPPRGTVFLGGVDVRDLDLQGLRAAVGVVTQRTEILSGTLEENITLFGDQPRAEVEAALAQTRPHRVGGRPARRARHPARGGRHPALGGGGAVWSPSRGC